MNMLKNIVVVFILFLTAIAGIDTLVISIDQDQLSTYDELTTGTNPLKPDTDGDGLQDGREVKVIHSDPMGSDTDGDGLPDGREMRELRSDPTAKDTDQDGLTDSQEQELGTDLTKADTDDDELTDQRELEVGTDPTDGDTDKDWLKDGWEIKKRAPNGAPLPEADPFHRDLYVDIVSLKNAPSVQSDTTTRIKAEFGNMPVQNPDGEEGINVHIHGPRKSDFTEQGLQERSEFDTQTLELATIGQFMYTSNRMGDRKGIRHLVVIKRGEASAGQADWKIAKVFFGPHQPSNQNTLIHELLHTIVPRVFDENCHGPAHPCEGYLSYKNDFFFSQETVAYIQNHPYANEESDFD